MNLEKERDLGVLSVLFAVALVAMLTGFAGPAQAELSDREYEKQLLEKRQDFELYVQGRAADREREVAGSATLREQRQKDQARQLQIEDEYRRTMKRYSMKEIEAKDRADEERLAKESIENETTRAAFVKQRERRADLIRKISPIDSYREFDIDMSTEPEAKTSFSHGLTEGT